MAQDCSSNFLDILFSTRQRHEFLFLPWANEGKYLEPFQWRLFVVVWSLSRVRLFCDPMDWGPPSSSVHGISQARTLEQVAISFSRGSSEIKPVSPALQVDSLTAKLPGNLFQRPAFMKGFHSEFPFQKGSRLVSCPAQAWKLQPPSGRVCILELSLGPSPIPPTPSSQSPLEIFLFCV